MGTAVIFVVTLAATAIVAVPMAIFSARGFLDVLEGTAAGNDDIPWPNNPLPDVLGAAFFLSYLVALPAVAVLGILRLTAPELLDGPSGPWPAPIAAAWLIFPILLLSALSGTSRWHVLHWGFLRRLLRHPIALVLFYLGTGVSLLIIASGAFFAVSSPHPLAAGIIVLAAAGLLIHGRLFGRLAWIVGVRTPESESHKLGRRRRLVKPIAACNPWKLKENEGNASLIPPSNEKARERVPTDSTAIQERIAFSPKGRDEAAEEEDEWTPNKSPYLFQATATGPPAQAPLPDAMKEAITSAPPLHRHLDENNDDTSLTMLPMVANVPADHPVEIQPDRIEVRWRENRKLAAPPRWPFFSGVWTFPFYQSTLPCLAVISGLGLVLVMLLRFLLSLSKMF